MTTPIDQSGFTEEERAKQLERIDFDQAVIVENVGPGSTGPLLHVSGETRCLNMHVWLSAVRYIQRPDYWIIYVNGMLNAEYCLEAIKPFNVLMSPIPLGHKGIMVVGETKSLRIDYPS
ncbi:MAG: hypothetical protein ACR2ME_07760 [Acidimicrobiia bacterium]